MPCDCIAEKNDFLAEHDTRLVVVERGGVQKIRVDTEKIPGSPRSKTIQLTATHCPFCGEKY